MSRTAKLAMAGTCIAACLFSVGAHAASVAVASSFGAKLTFDHSTYDNVYEPAMNSIGMTGFTATSFMITSAITLDHIDMALADGKCGGSLTKGYAVDIVGDSNGHPLGPVYYHWLETKVPSVCGPVKATKLAVKPTQSINLPGGQTYWVVLTPVGFDSLVLWFEGFPSSTGIGATLDTQDGGQTWFTSGVTPPPLALDVYRR